LPICHSFRLYSLARHTMSDCSGSGDVPQDGASWSNQAPLSGKSADIERYQLRQRTKQTIKTALDRYEKIGGPGSVSGTHAPHASGTQIDLIGQARNHQTWRVSGPLSVSTAVLTPLLPENFDIIAEGSFLLREFIEPHRGYTALQKTVIGGCILLATAITSACIARTFLF
jgi:hypothetical protein